MPQNTIDQIILNYKAMNKAHPFIKGNGRIARVIGLQQMGEF